SAAGYQFHAPVTESFPPHHIDILCEFRNHLFLSISLPHPTQVIDVTERPRRLASIVLPHFCHNPHRPAAVVPQAPRKACPGPATPVPDFLDACAYMGWLLGVK